MSRGPRLFIYYYYYYFFEAGNRGPLPPPQTYLYRYSPFVVPLSLGQSPRFFAAGVEI